MIVYSHSVTTEKVFQSIDKKSFTFFYPCSSHSSCSPYTVNVTKGNYYLEVYGAQGSNETDHNKFLAGGKGGYSAGVFQAESDATLYLFVGASTNSTISYSASYNGGGKGLNSNDGSGGGATDFRFNSDSLYARIIVAGGGGGSYTLSDLMFAGGAGGGLTGKPGNSSYGVVPCHGTQSSCNGGTYSSSYTHYEGTFGVGSGGYYGGGGGGYFGGGNTASGGAGGSGFIGGVFGNRRYKRVTKTGVNSGLGYAIITIINYNCLITQKHTFSPKLKILTAILLSSS